jgi:gustatory receptor
MFLTANIFLVCGPVEHLMALYSCVLRALPYSAGGLDVIRAFYTTWFEQVFKVTEYALWKALLLQLSNFVATFTWSYMDMFVTLVSMALTQKYMQLYERLLAVRGQVRHTKNRAESEVSMC